VRTSPGNDDEAARKKSKRCIGHPAEAHVNKITKRIEMVEDETERRMKWEEQRRLRPGRWLDNWGGQ